MENVNPDTAPIAAREIPEAERMQFLPRHFGRHMIVAEAMVFDWMGKLCESYHGGMWKFYDLDNGGFYMAPDEGGSMHLVWPSNWFEGDMSADAAGIVATLYAINGLLWNAPSEALETAYYALRDFAGEHAEARQIFAAID